MSKKHESYIHFDLCIWTLNEAYKILQNIKEEPTNPLRVPAFRYALIAYSKPYNRSDGIEKSKHILDTSCVPDKHIALHNRIVNSRNQVHAHTDLTLYEPQIFMDDSTPPRYAGYVSNHINEIEELANIDEIIELIEMTLLNMYEKEKALRSDLTP